MAHEKVYGICENKCKVEVVPKEQLLDLIYPVGSIYMSVNNVSPANFLGGTWSSWGSGKVPVGVNTSDSAFSTVEKTGGEKTHTLTISEIPKHEHSLTGYVSDLRDSVVQSGTGETGIAGYSEGGATGQAGGGYSHNNLQPYITCYMWKRTA